MVCEEQNIFYKLTNCVKGTPCPKKGKTYRDMYIHKYSSFGSAPLYINIHYIERSGSETRLGKVEENMLRKF